MKRNSRLAVRAVPPVVLACVAVAALAVAGRLFSAAPETPTWAAAFKNAEPQRYQNVVVVARSGGDFTSVQGALNSINDNSPTNPYLVWVAPGIYTETVTMKSYVDIEGAGELVTRIVHAGGSSNTGTVIGASNVELRFLTVQSTGGQYGIAINNIAASPSLLHVTAIASGGFGMNWTIYNANGASPTMNYVTASAVGVGGTYPAGVYNTTGASPTMNNVTASASGGIYSYGVYNYLNASPTMNNVTVSASDGLANYGVYNSNHSSPKMTGGTISVMSPNNRNSYGVSNEGNSSPTMVGVVITATGGGVNYAVYNFHAAATIRNSKLSAGGGTYNSGYAVYNAGYMDRFEVTVDNSTLAGSTNTIFNNTQYVTLVGASKLEGGPALGNGGQLTCAGVYDEKYNFYANRCP